MRALAATIRADLRANVPGAEGLRGFIYAALLAHGFQAVVSWRLAAYLYQKGGIPKLAGSLLSYWHAIYFGVHISPTAKIGPGLALPHPIGVGVGQGTVIGKDAVLYQNVSIGRSGQAASAYPRLGDRVTVYPGAVVAGPIEIRDDAVVGPNAIVMRSVGRGETAFGHPAKHALFRSDTDPECAV